MNTSDFDYHLPPELIAQEPLPERSASRMMVVRRETGVIEHKQVVDLPEYLNAGDLLVVNDTRVIPARVFGRRTDTGGRVEVLFLAEQQDCLEQRSDPAAEQGSGRGTGNACHTSVWQVLYRASRRPRPGTHLKLADGTLDAVITEVGDKGRVALAVSSDRPLQDILAEEGFAPLPPYIKRKKPDQSEPEDTGRRETTDNGQRKIPDCLRKEPGCDCCTDCRAPF